jgi:hypothetical protein
MIDCLQAAQHAPRDPSGVAVCYNVVNTTANGSFEAQIQSFVVENTQGAWAGRDQSSFQFVVTYRQATILSTDRVFPVSPARSEISRFTIQGQVQKDVPVSRWDDGLGAPLFPRVFVESGDSLKSLLDISKSSFLLGTLVSPTGTSTTSINVSSTPTGSFHPTTSLRPEFPPLSLILVLVWTLTVAILVSTSILRRHRLRRRYLHRCSRARE